ncbi:hypothetical protein N7462_005294 [Penicillium macrosclerotiorum]|uniref:uncharacterized protein n=1 Tax=Penicillium macrosclerotiorum TaxID=303699 RepID=UPI002549A31B|nr:uncharacterized protein N7462_005294 [Penicillium macrosclerotiorum]KAJ5690902.1 hypothetical protein N7462_005294 [Penicillium macrosclerotiorum]
MSKQIPASEYEAVVATVNLFIEGMKKSDYSILSKAFRDTARVYAHIYGTWTEANKDLLNEMLKSYPKLPNFNHNLSVISMSPTVAVVRIEMDYEDTFNPYTDFMTVAKVEGKWQIVTKVSCEYER